MNWWMIGSGVLQIIASGVEVYSHNWRWALVMCLIGIVNLLLGTKP